LSVIAVHGTFPYILSHNKPGKLTSVRVRARRRAALHQRCHKRKIREE
jgi:hypothetical protein